MYLLCSFCCLTKLSAYRCSFFALKFAMSVFSFMSFSSFLFNSSSFSRYLPCSTLAFASSYLQEIKTKFDIKLHILNTLKQQWKQFTMTLCKNSAVMSRSTVLDRRTLLCPKCPWLSTEVLPRFPIHLESLYESLLGGWKPLYTNIHKSTNSTQKFLAVNFNTLKLITRWALHQHEFLNQCEIAVYSVFSVGVIHKFNTYFGLLYS